MFHLIPSLNIQSIVAVRKCFNIILMLIIQIVQYSGFIASQITNSLLIYLIFSRAEKLFGNYRHIMSVFAFYSLFYSWIEILTQPLCHIRVPSVILLMDGPLKSIKWIGVFLPNVYCSSFAFCVSMLVSQFFYRYIAVCKPHLMEYLEGPKIFLIFVPCLVLFFIWFLVFFFCFSQTHEKMDFFKDIILKVYNDDLSKIPFSCAKYWVNNEDGTKKWKIDSIMGCVACAFTLSICFMTIIFCGYKTYHKMMSSQHFMSKKTMDLNRQLFITLSIQTILPTLLMYGPVSVVLIFPILGIDIGVYANIAIMSVAIYPCLEPIVAIFCISEFRNTIFCRKNKNRKKAITSNNCYVHNTTPTSKQ